MPATRNSPQLATSAHLIKARTRRMTCIAVVGLLVIATQSVHKSNAAVVYDLAADWSDTSNPSCTFGKHVAN